MTIASVVYLFAHFLSSSPVWGEVKESFYFLLCMKCISAPLDIFSFWTI